MSEISTAQSFPLTFLFPLLPSYPLTCKKKERTNSITSGHERRLSINVDP